MLRYTYVASLVGIKRRMDVAKETIEVVKSREVKTSLFTKGGETP